jgi:CRP/FNR family transcriptional regulator, nitrogen oxide reductase regulator
MPLSDVESVLKVTPVFSRLDPEDRRKVAEAATIRRYARGAVIFEQDAPSDAFYTIASGRAKVYRLLPTGKDMILEVFGPGDPLGALAAYDGRPFPASAAAVEETLCVVIPRPVFFRLLEEHPSLVRGLMLGLTHRVVELTNRLTELSGARIEPRFARLFLRLADEMGRTGHDGTFVPIALSRQELADMTGTTIETAIRIMSRWGKQSLVATEKDGFVILGREKLEVLAAE